LLLFKKKKKKAGSKGKGNRIEAFLASGQTHQNKAGDRRGNTHKTSFKLCGEKASKSLTHNLPILPYRFIADGSFRGKAPTLSTTLTTDRKLSSTDGPKGFLPYKTPSDTNNALNFLRNFPTFNGQSWMGKHFRGSSNPSPIIFPKRRSRIM